MHPLTHLMVVCYRLSADGLVQLRLVAALIWTEGIVACVVHTEKKHPHSSMLTGAQ